MKYALDRRCHAVQRRLEQEETDPSGSKDRDGPAHWLPAVIGEQIARNQDASRTIAEIDDGVWHRVNDQKEPSFADESIDKNVIHNKDAKGLVYQYNRCPDDCSRARCVAPV